MTLVFNANDGHTLGVEIELQLVDGETLQLANCVQDVLAKVPDKWSEAIKPEFMQSYCEINSGVCRTVDQVRIDLDEKLEWLYEVAAPMGLRFLWGGTHPISSCYQQQVTPDERYHWLLDTMQIVARRLVVFGLHIHVGVDSGDKAIQMCDRLLRHLPTLLALSANSPMWSGKDTGLASYRSKVMEALPTAGLPPTMRNWSEYVWLIDHLISTNFIQTNREIWWDVRPHAGFGTVELRVMDNPMSMKHLLGLTALTQSLVAAISDQIDRGAYLYDSHPIIAKQNKWHASRYGMDADFVDFDTMRRVPARDAAARLIGLCSPFAEELGCHEQLRYLDDVLENGTGAARQRRILNDTGDMQDVLRFLAEQSEISAEDGAPRYDKAVE